MTGAILIASGRVPKTTQIFLGTIQPPVHLPNGTPCPAGIATRHERDAARAQHGTITMRIHATTQRFRNPIARGRVSDLRNADAMRTHALTVASAVLSQC
jgi:hypothetical protein